MDLKKGKKGLIVKTWERCTSLGGGSKSFGHGEKLKSKSWPRLNLTEDEKVVLRDCNYSKTGRVDPVNPVGCFSVYVGYEKQRFVVKTGCLNHPLFLKLLEEAETEYGFKRNGPIELPCEVDDFLKVLLEMDCDYVSPKCTFGKKSNSSYHLLTSPKLFSLKKEALANSMTLDRCTTPITQNRTELKKIGSGFKTVYLLTSILTVYL